MADAPSESLGIRLKREREKHHWTQEELAQKSDVSVSSIRRWENNRAMPRPDERTRLAKALGKPPDEWGIASPRWNVPFPRTAILQAVTKYCRTCIRSWLLSR